MKRRKFIRSASLAAGAASLAPTNVFRPSSVMNNIPENFFIGTPVLPEYLYEEGIAETLDAMQDLVGIKTVMTFSHSHVFRQYRKDFAPLHDDQGKEITDVFVKTHPEYYSDPALQAKNFDAKYAGRDILDELHEECAPRGMNVYARILEPYRITGAIPGFEEFAEIDVYGNKGPNVCYNHPGYIQYWESVVNDLVYSHPYLAGFKFGQERGGPMFSSLSGNPATCFCEYCRKLGKERGYNPEVARKGMLELKNYSEKIKEGKDPRDGFFVTFLRIQGNYPDLLSWEKLWMDSREGQRKRFYTQIKKINPSIQVGWHIDHGMTWDLITRTFDDYSTKGPYSDWLSTAVYFDSMGRRSMKHYEKFYHKLLFADASPQHSYPMYLSMLGYDPAKEPSLEDHKKHDTSFSSDYVYSECKRAVDAVDRAAKIYARPGFDMPGYDCNVQPQDVKKAVTKALEAGVDGLWCGREWDELKSENAKAFGEAVKEWFS